MRSETLAIHGGYDGDPTTKAVAVPIYQTVAYEFDSADHGAALFNLETPGYRYSRIANPTVDVLERRVRRAGGWRCRALHQYGPGRAELRDRQPCRSRWQHRLRAAALRDDAYVVRPCPATPGHPHAFRRERQRGRDGKR